MGTGCSTDAPDTWTVADAPDQTGRVVCITGANSGLGFDAAKVFAARGARVILCARDPTRGAEALAELRKSPTANQDKVHLELLDLSDSGSVHAFADRAARREGAFVDGIDVLVLNAGVMAPPEKQMSADGFESQWASNHLGHYLLVGRLLPVLRASVKSPTVVPVSSVRARGGRLHLRFRQHETPDFADLRSPYDAEAIYADTKQANLLFAVGLDRRHGSWLRVVPCHPGVCATNLFRDLWYRHLRFSFQDAAAGAAIEVRAATDPSLPAMSYVGTGDNRWKGPPTVEAPAPHTVDGPTAEWLWWHSAKAVGFDF